MTMIVTFLEFAFCLYIAIVGLFAALKLRPSHAKALWLCSVALVLLLAADMPFILDPGMHLLGLIGGTLTSLVAGFELGAAVVMISNASGQDDAIGLARLVCSWFIPVRIELAAETNK